MFQMFGQWLKNLSHIKWDSFAFLFASKFWNVTSTPKEKNSNMGAFSLLGVNFFNDLFGS